MEFGKAGVARIGGAWRSEAGVARRGSAGTGSVQLGVARSSKAGQDRTGKVW